MKISFYKFLSDENVQNICAFLSAFVFWYFLGVFWFPNYNGSRELQPLFKEYLIWSFESGAWFHYSLIGVVFGIISVALLYFLRVNWKYLRGYFESMRECYYYDRERKRDAN